MKLSVAMLTYNHEQFIVEALESILMQEADFEYEIVVGDDLSTDATRDILTRYQNRYPDKFRLLFYDTKQGVGGNVYEVFKACRGEYIAILEGDDYWLSPLKLKTQIALLDANLDIALCFHPVYVYSQIEDEIVAVDGGASSGKVYNLNDLMRQIIFPRTCSVVFRSQNFQLPTWVKDLTHLDFIIFVFAVQQGLLKSLDETMAVYRRHDQGVYSGANSITAIRNNINSFSILNMHFQYRYADHLNMRKYYGSLAREFKKAGNDLEARNLFWQFITLPHSGKLDLHQALNVFIIIYTPWIYTFYRWLRYNKVTPVSQI